MSDYLCRSCERSVLFNGGAYCRHFQCVKGIVTGCTSYKPIEQEAPPPPLNTRRCLFTNADRIRAMTDDELAIMFAQRIDCMDCPLDIIQECNDKPSLNNCKRRWLDWLKQEVTTNSTT